MQFFNSKIDEVEVNNQKYFVKRDDLLNSDFSGNKARKFHYFLNEDLTEYKKIISHGSIQSNAMYSLSVLAKLKNLEFEYYVKNIPSYLLENPSGNYKEALNNDMKLIVDELKDNFEKDELFIIEGGAVKEAKYGLEILANEIKTWAKENKIDKLKIFLPSGTGTTALYLQQYLPFEVLTCSCVGDDDYLKKQFDMLEIKNHPTILKKTKKYHFGKLYREFYFKHLELFEQTNIEFDLLYDSLGWIVFEDYVNNFEHKKEYTFLYIHQGGLLGNKTMLERYRYKFTII
ncbi:1-aminocyclopropane-1-carboxylate deaminase [Aliarcobacter cibarius]|jgi:1-aminocyclopropane-1-carboxylate deaminase|uniref:1-aminocyclopropane-1-carboxylate deaminase n=1 Tax=Aliarcobacter cibarius TaxID=255507 RepID=A0A7L5JRR4_9BACT|nr:1-aminocyclopropane-1-carboxylate deaminase [Aliarcobacter cibarius]QKJ27750.1 1-aminocyclopropane-1-carboxylate deaminase [Aliarcobacter cibarius]TLT01098.1 1-aminocyclopropane-1-carboxylate deaminase [Aliarcobacter cibarius]TLT01195.1 1-aminocyclopropane-1-carboxylate deaminase [Aliarcobacter cibarius]TLT04990.1 1-aminocyclopropane-1-carboxylate deaminase [Aliarcobacter cibarius]